MKFKKASYLKGNRLLFFFFVGVIILIIIGIITKVVITYMHSSYDGKQQFILAVYGKGREVAVIVASPDNKSLGLLDIKNLKGQSLQKTIVIPVDAEAINQDLPLNVSETKLLQRLFWQFGNFHTRGMTVIDALRLYLFSKSLKSDAKTTQIITLPMNQVILNQQVQTVITDHTLYKEGQSIAIVNASGQDGIGTRLAQLLTNIGGNIVSVTTSQEDQATSTIGYTGTNPSYTATRLQKILGLTLVPMQSKGLSDIMITVGSKGVKKF